MAEIINLYRSAPDMLRRIADLMESSEIIDDECTLVTGQEIWHCGGSDNLVAARAVFNLQFGIHKMMTAAVGDDES